MCVHDCEVFNKENISLILIGRKYRHIFPILYCVWQKFLALYAKQYKKAKKGRENSVKYLKVLGNNEDDK